MAVVTPILSIITKPHGERESVYIVISAATVSKPIGFSVATPLWDSRQILSCDPVSHIISPNDC